MMDLHNKGQNLDQSTFRNIHPEELSDYIKGAKTAVMEGLRERLEHENDTSEWQSLAFSIGTLSELERVVARWQAGSRRRP